MISFMTFEDMTPHGFCLLWDENLLALTILANGLTAIAYFMIPLQIIRAMHAYNLRLPKWLMIMFSMFIFGCGVDHVFDVVTLFYPFYWVQAAWSTVTMVVSVFTAFTMMFGFHASMGRLNQYGAARRLDEK